MDAMNHVKEFDPDQPRDEDGKWSAEGGSGDSVSGTASAIEKHLGIKPKYSHITVLGADEFDSKFGSPDDAVHGGIAAIRTNDGGIWIKKGYESDALHEMSHAAGMSESGVTTFMNEGVTQAASEFIAKESGLKIRKTYADEVSFVKEYVAPATGMSDKDFFSGYAKASDKAKFIADAIWKEHGSKFSDKDDWGASPQKSLEKEVARAIGPGPYLSHIASVQEKSKKNLGTTGQSSDTISNSDLTTEKGQGMADENLALEAAKMGDFSRRALMEQTWDVILPLHGASSNPEEVGLCQSIKSVGEHFKVDGATMSVSAVLSDESGPDRAKEILVLDGGDLDGWKRNPLGLFQHNKMLPVSLYQNPDSKEFTVRRINKQLIGTEYFVQKGPMAELAEQVFQLHECGLLRGKSLGFLSAFRDYERIPDDPQNAYGPATTKIKAWKAFECSSVFIPENDRSLVTQVVRKGLGQGVGLKALAAPLAAMLVQYAEPTTEWVPGGTGEVQTKTMPGGTTMSADAGEQIKCTKCGCGFKAFANGDGCCPSCTALTVGVLKKELETFTKPGEGGKSLRDRAESAVVMEKAIGNGIGLNLNDYAGRPHQKALRAIYDTAMFNATSAIVTMQNYDGATERSLREVAAEQIDKAQKCLNEYAATYPGEDMSWSAMNPGDIADAWTRGGDTEETTKALVRRCADWAVRTKGWARGHSFRIQEATKTLKTLLTKPSDKPLSVEERADIEAKVKSLEEIVRENGTLVHVLDAETDAKIKALGETLTKTNQELETVRKALNAAKYGRSY